MVNMSPIKTPSCAIAQTNACMHARINTIQQTRKHIQIAILITLPCPSSPLLSAASSGSELTLPSSLTGDDSATPSLAACSDVFLLRSPPCSGMIMSGGVRVPEDLAGFGCSSLCPCEDGTSTGSSNDYKKWMEIHSGSFLGKVIPQIYFKFFYNLNTILISMAISFICKGSWVVDM